MSVLRKTNSSSRTTVSARSPWSPVSVRPIARRVVTTMATHGVRRSGSTSASGRGSSPCSAMPNTTRLDMIMVSRAPLATAISAMACSSRRGRRPGGCGRPAPRRRPSRRPGVLGHQLCVGRRGEHREHEGDQHRQPHRAADLEGDHAGQRVDAGAEDVAEDEEEQQFPGDRPLEARVPAVGVVFRRGGRRALLVIVHPPSLGACRPGAIRRCPIRWRPATRGRATHPLEVTDPAATPFHARKALLVDKGMRRRTGHRPPRNGGATVRSRASE